MGRKSTATPKRRSRKAAKPKVRRGRGNGKPGHPIEATDEVLARIAELVEEGNYLETAIEHEGLSVSHVRRLLRDGVKELKRMELDGEAKPARGLERQVGFAVRIRQARAKAEAADLRFIGSSKAWQARAWRLERKFPERWGRRDRLEHTGEGGGSIDVTAHVDIARARLRDALTNRLRKA